MAPRMKNMGPGCCCFTGCGIYSDAFDSTLAASWTVSSGTWSTSGGELVGTGAGLIYNTTDDPGGIGEDVSVSLRYTFTLGGGATNTFRLLISLRDTSNYLYAEITRSSAGSLQVTLGEVVAGVDTELSDPIPLTSSVSLNTYRNAYLCYFSSTNKLRFSDGSAFSQVGVEVDATGIGDMAGIEIITGNAKFDDFSFGRAYSGSALECDHCNTETCDIAVFVLSGTVDSFFWETITGSWGTDFVPSGDSILKSLRPHPLDKGTMYLRIVATDLSVGETVRGYVNWADSSNHLMVDVGWDSSTAFRQSLYRVSSGTPTLLDERFMTTPSAASFDQTVTLKICYDGASLSAESVLTGVGIAGYTGLHSSSAATEITDGVWAAMGSNGGPRFTAFGLQKYYSEDEPGELECPICPASCGCEASHVPRGNYTVDFGAGGWTDAGCDYCDQIAGEFVLGEWIENDCRTVYLDEDVCIFDECGGGDPEQNKSLRIILSLVSGSVSPQKKWQLTVILDALATDDPGCCAASARAVFESADFDPDECDVVPVTLSKISDSVNHGNCPSLPQNICNGSLPSSITIDET